MTDLQVPGGRCGGWRAKADHRRRADEFRRKAEGAERVANETSDELERDTYRKIAEGWWGLAQSAILSERRRA